MLLTLLYAAGGDPIPVERFHRLRARGRQRPDGLRRRRPRGRRRAAAVAPRRHRAARRAGAARRRAPRGEPRRRRRRPPGARRAGGRDDPDPTLVGLTPIGLWAVREMLWSPGVHAPLVGELAEEDIEYVCVRLRRDAPGGRRGRARGLGGGARPRRAAAHEVLRYLQRAGGPGAPRPGAVRAAPRPAPAARRPRGPAAAADRRTGPRAAQLDPWSATPARRRSFLTKLLLRTQRFARCAAATSP